MLVKIIFSSSDILLYQSIISKNYVNNRLLEIF